MGTFDLEAAREVANAEVTYGDAGAWLRLACAEVERLRVLLGDQAREADCLDCVNFAAMLKERDQARAEAAQYKAELELRDKSDGVCSRAACDSVRAEVVSLREQLDIERITNEAHCYVINRLEPEAARYREALEKIEFKACEGALKEIARAALSAEEPKG